MTGLPEHPAQGSGRDCLTGGGEMGARMREHAWSKTALGPIENWPQSLKTIVSLMLNSRYPMFVWWGQELTNFYNDAYIPILGKRHPEAMGLPAAIIWKDIWSVVGRQAEEVINEGRSTWNEDLLLVMERYGYTEETYFTFSYSPVPNDDGSIGGVFCACKEETARVLGERRLKTLREMAQKTADARTAEDACNLCAEATSNNPYDIPFSLIYLIDSAGERAWRAGASGIEADMAASPSEIIISQTEAAADQWPLASAIAADSIVVVDDIATRFGALPGGPWPEPAQMAVLLPILQPNQKQPAGFLIAGISPRLMFDDDYRGFVNLVAGQVASGIINARSYEAERKRSEGLAQLDRAKTTFFSNVSHEFRTPLTLILSPLEQALFGAYGPFNEGQRQEIERIRRNAVRLLKLVNTMLDFSRIESNRIDASYEPTDISRLTSELASVFRSAIESAGLRFVVDCPTLPESVYVDREMWEKIVLNLLSNALKFTFEGEIVVALRWAEDQIELEVSDTGTGIPESEMSHIFERFHRIRGARARTQEGTGIGLALVRELVHLHGGTVQVSSTINQGTTFTVTIPAGSAHLPAERIGSARTMDSTTLGSEAFVEEAERWLSEGSGNSHVSDVVDKPAQVPAADSDRLMMNKARILLADDNSDMRDYLRRLFGERWNVEVVADGLSALVAARENLPDLLITDVMMPGLDGFELLRELRNDPRTREVPVILLSARAGEESRLEGLEAGADDYLIKPFSARELVARAVAHIEMGQIRREASRREQELNTEVKAAKEQLEQILASINDHFIMYDRDWRFVYVNDRASQGLGLAREQLIGQRIWDLFPSSVGNFYYQELHRAVSEQQDIIFEYYSAIRNQWFENRVYVLDDGVVVFATDITERKRSEDALRQSEERFSKAFEASPHLMTISTLAEGRYVDVNDAVLRATGHTRESIIGHTVDELGIYVDTDGRQRLLRELQEKGAVRDLDVRFRARDGRLLNVLLSAEIIDLNGEKCLLTTSNDITERKRTEEALRQSERLYRAIGESINYGIWVCDADGRNIYASESFLNLVGLTQQQCSEFGWGDVLHPDDVEETIRAWKECTATGSFWEREHRFRGVDGHWHYLLARGVPIRDDDGNIYCWAGINLDIGSLKRSEQALRESEERFRNMADNSPVMIWVTEPDGVCTYLSKSCYEFTGQTPETGLGFGWMNATHPDDYERVHEVFLSASAKRESFRMDYRLRNIEGEYRWVIDSASPRFSPQGEFLGYIGSVIDITDRKQIESSREQLLKREQEAREMAELANRLKDEFLATLSHELRTPLNAIIGWTEMLSRGQSDLSLIEHALKVILRNARSQAQLVEDLLDVSRIITGKFQLDAHFVELIPVVEAAIDSISPAAEARGIRIRKVFDYSTGAILGDSTRLQQVVWNLLSNAVKFTPRDGTVEVRIEQVGSNLEVVISDTGQGIKADFLPHIFDRFRQADSSHTRKHTGLGLGLAIVRHLAELHGGTVEAFSDGEGKGSTFKVKLPLLSVNLEKNLSAEIGHQNNHSNNNKNELEGLRILIVDDHADTRDMISLVLEMNGAEVRAADTAATAFEILKDWNPDVLVSDLGMPDEDGYDLIGKVRGLSAEEGGDIPALALTGYASTEEGERTAKAGYQLHMAKPVEPDRLVSAIGRLTKKK